MQIKYLLPHKYRRIGWIMLLPFLVLGILSVHMDFEFSWLSMVIRPEGGFLDSPARENFTNELAAIGVALSLIFIAFSREEIEDEYIMKLRLESLLVAVLVNYGLLLLAIAFIYSMGFFLALVYNMYTILILFIARFYWVKHKQQKLLAS